MRGWISLLFYCRTLTNSAAETYLRRGTLLKDLGIDQQGTDSVLYNDGFSNSLLYEVSKVEAYAPIETMVSPFPITCSVRAGDSSLPGGKYVSGLYAIALSMWRLQHQLWLQMQ